MRSASLPLQTLSSTLFLRAKVRGSYQLLTVLSVRSSKAPAVASLFCRDWTADMYDRCALTASVIMRNRASFCSQWTRRFLLGGESDADDGDTASGEGEEEEEEEAEEEEEEEDEDKEEAAVVAESAATLMVMMLLLLLPTSMLRERERGRPGPRLSCFPAISRRRLRARCSSSARRALSLSRRSAAPPLAAFVPGRHGH